MTSGSFPFQLLGEEWQLSFAPLSVFLLCLNTHLTGSLIGDENSDKA